MPHSAGRKRCSKCRKTLPLRFFYRKRAMPDGYAASCKACAAEYARGCRPRWRALRQGPSESTLAISRKKALTALSRFVAREGHTRVPPQHVEDGIRLGRWVVRRRADANLGRMSADLARSLEAIPGWSWHPREEGFQRGLDLLKGFAARAGHCCVPGAHRELGFRLGVWVAARRTDHRLGRLAPDRVAALTALPQWHWSARPFLRRRHGERALAALRRFAAREGHTSVPRGHRESGVGLANAVRRWRAAWKKGELDPLVARKLQRLPGWAWGIRIEAFGRGLERLRRYVAREGHARVPVAHLERGFKLGWWVAIKRRDHRKGRLADYQVRALEAVSGWAWDLRTAR